MASRTVREYIFLFVFSPPGLWPFIIGTRGTNTSLPKSLEERVKNQGQWCLAHNTHRTTGSPQRAMSKSHDAFVHQNLRPIFSCAWEELGGGRGGCLISAPVGSPGRFPHLYKGNFSPPNKKNFILFFFLRKILNAFIVSLLHTGFPPKTIPRKAAVDFNIFKAGMSGPSPLNWQLREGQGLAQRQE